MKIPNKWNRKIEVVYTFLKRYFIIETICNILAVTAIGVCCSNMSNWNLFKSIILIVSIVEQVASNGLSGWSKWHYKYDGIEWENAIYKLRSERMEIICNKKLDTLKNHISDIEKKALRSCPLIISDPETQLREILTRAKECLVSIINTGDCNYTFNDISISLIYKFSNGINNEWNEININNDTNILNLLEAEGSKF